METLFRKISTTELKGTGRKIVKMRLRKEMALALWQCWSCVQEIQEIFISDRKNSIIVYFVFTGSLKAGEIFCFIVFTLFTTLLVLYEMYQVAVLRKQYMQMENFIEWFVFISAIFTPFVKVYLAKIQIPLFIIYFTVILSP